MFVAGRLLNIEGKDRNFGEPVPEAQSWLPHIRKAHLDTGAIIDVDDKRAMELHEVAKRDRAQSEIDFANRKASEQQKRFEQALAQAKKLELEATEAWAFADKLKKETERVLAEAKRLQKDLSGSAPLQAPGNAEGAADKAAPSKFKLKVSA